MHGFGSVSTHPSRSGHDRFYTQRPIESKPQTYVPYLLDYRSSKMRYNGGRHRKTKAITKGKQKKTGRPSARPPNYHHPTNLRGARVTSGREREAALPRDHPSFFPTLYFSTVSEMKQQGHLQMDRGSSRCNRLDQQQGQWAFFEIAYLGL